MEPPRGGWRTTISSIVSKRSPERARRMSGSWLRVAVLIDAFVTEGSDPSQLRQGFAQLGVAALSDGCLPLGLDVCVTLDCATVERLAAPRYPDDAGAVVRGVLLECQVSRPLEMAQQVVHPLLADLSRRGNLGRPAP